MVEVDAIAGMAVKALAPASVARRVVLTSRGLGSSYRWAVLPQTPNAQISFPARCLGASTKRCRRWGCSHAVAQTGRPFPHWMDSFKSEVASIRQSVQNGQFLRSLTQTVSHLLVASHANEGI